MRCGVHYNWSTDKNGKCGRRSFCTARTNTDCGERLYARELFGRLNRAYTEQRELEKELIE